MATLVLSMEVELGWGTHDKGDFSHLSEGRTAETKTLNELLEICDNYRIPFSFDVVGHLFHESCSGHPESPHPTKWFAADPQTDYETDPIFYAPDLVSAIRDANTEHEICTHTYSHALCNQISDSAFSWELEQVTKAHSEFGIAVPKSIVTPRHQEPSDEVLRDYGIRIIRTPVPGYRDRSRGNLETFWWILTRSHPVRPARVQNGVIRSYCTPHPSLTATHLPEGQQSPHPAFSAIPLRIRQWLHRRYLQTALETAVAKDTDIHLWTHLFNLSNEHQLAVVKDFLSTAARYRDNDELSIVTMAEFDTGAADLTKG